VGTIRTSDAFLVMKGDIFRVAAPSCINHCHHLHIKRQHHGGDKNKSGKLLDGFGKDREKASALYFRWVACIIFLCFAQVSSAYCEQAMKIMI
jgi:hypothetical protein